MLCRGKVGHLEDAVGICSECLFSRYCFFIVFLAVQYLYDRQIFEYFFLLSGQKGELKAVKREKTCLQVKLVLTYFEDFTHCFGMVV